MRTIIGILIAFFAFVTAFSMAAGGGHGLGEMIGRMNFGAVIGLIFADVVLALGGLLLGGLLIAFRAVDLFACL
ncbi:uncharacterized protein METZ01_LOCUS492935, partial [marine metagenome]